MKKTWNGRIGRLLRKNSSIIRYGLFFSAGIIIIYLFTMNAAGSGKKESDHQGDTITFSGFKWTTKNSNGKQTGPGNNYFSGSKDNIYVDALGKLHLRITYRNDKWYCPEVHMLEPLGYGRCYFYLDPLPQPLDKDVVIGMFLYDREDTSNFHKEIDIELSTWGKGSGFNTQYVIQPKEDEAHRFLTDLSLPTRHMIELRRSKVIFRTYYDNSGPDDIPLEIARKTEKPDYEYSSGNERICINVWLYRTSEPSNLKEFEVVISRFEFKQFWYDRLFNPIKN